MSSRTVLVAGALLVVGCDAQVTPGYRGEKLGKIEGSIVTGDETAPDAAAALLWWTPSALSSSLVTTPVATTGEFPSAFTLSLYRYPPQGVIFKLADRASYSPFRMGARVCQGAAQPPGKIAIAHIAAVKPDGEDTLGVSETYVLAYVQEPLPAGAEGAAWGGPLAAGYHLMELDWDDAESGAPAGECQGAGSFRLREAPEGLGTRIEIRLGSAG